MAHGGALATLGQTGYDNGPCPPGALVLGWSTGRAGGDTTGSLDLS